MIVDGYEVHTKKQCKAPCPFHAPSDHPLKDAPMVIRSDKLYLVERICKHGIGHDDPDSVAYLHTLGEDWAGVHGCDGCCSKTFKKDIAKLANDTTRSGLKPEDLKGGA